MKLGINYIHCITDSYVTSNTYFVAFVILGVNTFMITGVNPIYKLIRYNKFTFIFINLRSSVFISTLKVYYLLPNS